MAQELDPDYPVVASLQMGDREYNLVYGVCTQCGERHYRILRFCGTAYACYHLPDSFLTEDFEEFVHRVDEELMQTSADMLANYKYRLDQENSQAGIDADFSREFLVREYARQRLSKLQKLGLLDALLTSDEPRNDLEVAVRIGFELGAAVNEENVMHCFEEYMYDGMAVEEWRNSGLPKAREERIRQGKRSRKAILEAAKTLYGKNPDLLRNDTETARAIQKLKVAELQRENGSSLGLDAITKHLRAARIAHDQFRKS